jgi:hypothetical protein
LRAALEDERCHSSSTLSSIWKPGGNRGGLWHSRHCTRDTACQRHGNPRGPWGDRRASRTPIRCYGNARRSPPLRLSFLLSHDEPSALLLADDLEFRDGRDFCRLLVCCVDDAEKVGAFIGHQHPCSSTNCQAVFVAIAPRFSVILSKPPRAPASLRAPLGSSS